MVRPEQRKQGSRERLGPPSRQGPLGEEVATEGASGKLRNRVVLVRETYGLPRRFNVSWTLRAGPKLGLVIKKKKERILTRTMLDHCLR